MTLSLWILWTRTYSDVLAFSSSNTTAAGASQTSVEITVALDFSLPASIALGEG